MLYMTCPYDEAYGTVVSELDARITGPSPLAVRSQVGMGVGQEEPPDAACH